MKIILVEERTDGGRESERTFEKDVVNIGRDASLCDVAYDSAAFPMVSRKHAELRFQNGQWFVMDLNSSYGTFVDGQKLVMPQPVAAGQRIQFGPNGPVVRIASFNANPAKGAKPVWPQAPAQPAQPLPQAPRAPLEATVNPFDKQKPQPQPPAIPPAQPKPPAPNTSARLEFAGEPGRAAYDLSVQGIALGRDPGCDIPFDPGLVMMSRVHAHIHLENGNFILEDNKTFNGTFVNGQRIAGPTPLYHMDEVQLGVGGPLLRFNSPSRVAPAGASLAGQRMVAASNMAPAFMGGDEGGGGSKTVVAKFERSSSSLQMDNAQPQLLMSLAFGGKQKLTIGRDEGNDVRLDGLQISTRHARLIDTGTGVGIEDLNSTNGTYVNGNRVSRAALTPADSVQIGSFMLRIDQNRNIGVFDTRSKVRIDAVNITKDVGGRFGSGQVRLLDSISLSIQPNEFIGILGPSGGGKSTLMDAMNGMRPATGGNILVNNLDLYQHIDSLKQSIGYVPQDDIIHRELTIYRTLYYVAKLRLSSDVSSAEIDQTINEVLDVTGLSERRDVAVGQLSGGQRKRVSIAVELITKPSIIYLDEPTSGLDPGTEEKIMKLFRQIADSGRTVILTTHAMENVKLFDKIIVLMRGRLVFFGKPDEAMKHLGAANFKELFDKLEEPVNEGVKRQGEGLRKQLTDQTADAWRQKFIQTPIYRQNIDEPLRQLGKQPPSRGAPRHGLGIFGSIRQWLMLSLRYAEVLFKDKMNLFILLAQAPVIAVLTFFVMGNNLPRDLVYFVIALVAVWFGTSVSAREIIREHAIYNRERMVNLGLIPYLASKIFVLGVIVGVQCFLVFIPLKFFDVTGLMPMPGNLGGIPQIWVMLLTASVGITLGLLVSALVKTSEMATSIVPLILIPQILFSGVFGVPSGINKPVGLIIPAALSFDTIKRYSPLDTLEAEGSPKNGRTNGLGLYKYIETENDKIIAKAQQDMKDYQKSSEDKLKKYEDDMRAGKNPASPKFNDPPPIPPAVKMPKDLSPYITFRHPWMHEILNQFILMLMFWILVAATLIVLRLRDMR